MNDDKMWCIFCGHIETDGEEYEKEVVGGDEFNVCPDCGNWDCGGYPSYAPLFLWPQEMVDQAMIKINQEMIMEVEKI